MLTVDINEQNEREKILTVDINEQNERGKILTVDINVRFYTLT